MTARFAIALAALSNATTLSAAPAPSTFVYCSAQSTSPRGQGLIVTAIFPSRSELAFIETAFTHFLRTSYAPYGNGWEFTERGVTCLNFIDRRKAEIQRSLDISRIPQPIQSIYPVTFQLG